MFGIAIQAASAFGAGFATSLSPCVYPMLPITLGYLGSNANNQNSQKRKVIGFFIGQVLTFTLLGAVAVSIGEIFGFSSEIPEIQIGIGALLVLLAYVSYSKKLPAFFYKLNNFQPNVKANTFLSSIFVGAASASVASPCTSPVLGAVLASISQVEQQFVGIFLMFCFSLGISFLFLLLGLGLAKANKLPKSGEWMNRVHQISSVLLGVAGFFFLYRGISLL